MKNKLLKITSILLLILNAAPIYADGYDPRCPQRCDLGNFSVGADWLYWKTEESKLDYGAAVTSVGSNDNIVISSTILAPKFEYNSGFRVFANYKTCNELWNFSAIYTHVPTTASSHFTAVDGPQTNFASLFDATFPIFTAISSTTYSSLHSRWKTCFNYFDFDVARTFSFCECLQIIPHIGIRALWLHQVFGLSGVANPSIAVALADGENPVFSSKLSSCLTSVGLEGGLNGAWQICENLSLVGSVGGSILYASVDSHGTLVAVNTIDNTVKIKYKDHNCIGMPMFDAFIGVSYDKCCENYNFNVRLGWEEHVIFNTNPFSISDSGTYTLQGLTLGAAVGF